MKFLSFFLFIILICTGLSNAIWEKDSVNFKNSLRPKNILRISCVSDQDDFGLHYLSPGQTYELSFKESVLKTKFDCELWQGSNYEFYATFRAYEGGGVIVHYGKNNFWDAREDGIYFTHGKDTPKLEYKWRKIQSKDMF